MKVTYYRERPSKKVEDAPRSMQIFDDQGDHLGEIEFLDTVKHGMEIVVYSYSPKLTVGSCTDKEPEEVKE